MKRAKDLTREQLERLVDDLQQIAFLEPEPGDSFVFSPDKELDSDTLEAIVNLLSDFELAPTGRVEYAPCA